MSAGHGSAVWLLKLGIAVIHSRPYHPQSRGKNERFHRTLKAEVFALRRFRDLAETQHVFDAWREVYNYERPHEALDQQVPASRYRPSSRSMPDRLPAPEYDNHEIVRTVPATKAYISFQGPPVESSAGILRRTSCHPPARQADGEYGVFFAAHQVATIDLTEPAKVSVMSPNRCRPCPRTKHQARQ